MRTYYSQSLKVNRRCAKVCDIVFSCTYHPLPTCIIPPKSPPPDLPPGRPAPPMPPIIDPARRMDQTRNPISINVGRNDKTLTNTIKTNKAYFIHAAPA